MTTKTFTNIKDLEKAILNETNQKVKKIIDEFSHDWKLNNEKYQQYTCFGVIVNNYDKIIEFDTKVVRNGIEILMSIWDFNEFASAYSFNNGEEERSIYESFIDDFERYCKENKLPIKRA